MPTLEQMERWTLMMERFAAHTGAEMRQETLRMQRESVREREVKETRVSLETTDG
jgi:hypothetical protein